MTLYTETDEHGTEYLVSSAGNQDFRLRIDDHERQELQRIAGDLVDEDAPAEGDLGTFVDTDGTEYNAVVTKVWDEGTVNLAYSIGEGAMQEATSVVVGADSYGFEPGGW